MVRKSGSETSKKKNQENKKKRGKKNWCGWKIQEEESRHHLCSLYHTTTVIQLWKTKGQMDIRRKGEGKESEDKGKELGHNITYGDTCKDGKEEASLVICLGHLLMDKSGKRASRIQRSVTSIVLSSFSLSTHCLCVWTRVSRVLSLSFSLAYTHTHTDRIKWHKDEDAKSVRHWADVTKKRTQRVSVWGRERRKTKHTKWCKELELNRCCQCIARQFIHSTHFDSWRSRLNTVKQMVPYTSSLYSNFEPYLEHKKNIHTEEKRRKKEHSTRCMSVKVPCNILLGSIVHTVLLDGKKESLFLLLYFSLRQFKKYILSLL